MPRIAISAFDAMMRASSSTWAFRARADEVIPQGAFAAVYESESVPTAEVARTVRSPRRREHEATQAQ